MFRPLDIPLPEHPPEQRQTLYKEVLKSLRDDGVRYRCFAALVGVFPECISKRIRGHVAVTQEAYLSALYIRDLADREIEIKEMEEEEV